MKKNFPNILGIFLVTLGVLSIFRQITGIDIWKFIFPLLLVLLGLFMIFKPKINSQSKESTIRFLGEIYKDGQWNVQSQEIWLFIGDLKLDFRNALVPDGISEIHIFGFVQDLRIIEAQNVGISLHTNAFISDYRIFDQKKEAIFSNFDYKNLAYDQSGKKIDIICWAFINETRYES